MTRLLNMSGTVFGIYFQATYSGLKQSQSTEKSSWEKMKNTSSVDDRPPEKKTTFRGTKMTNPAIANQAGTERN